MKAINNLDTVVFLLLLLAARTPVGYAQTPPPPPKVVYLSDLTPVGTPVNGYGPYEKDKSNGEDAAGDGNPLKVGGVTYARGLGVHAASDLTFALDKQYVNFSAVVGLDDELLTNGCAPKFPGSVVFEVFVDDMKMYDSGTLTISTPPKTVTVDVSGKTTLRLAVGGAGDGLECDHADWADAKLTRPGTPLNEVTRNEGTSLTFSASSGFSSTQGLNGWSYLDTTGAQLTYRPPTSPYPSDAWQGSEQYLILWRDGGHPGDTKDPVRRWTAPLAGTIRITGNAHDEDTACGRGVTVMIKKGTATLWQRDIRNGDTAGANFDLTSTVNQNDTVDFIINQGADGNSLCDTTFFDPTILLTK